MPVAGPAPAACLSQRCHCSHYGTTCTTLLSKVQQDIKLMFHVIFDESEHTTMVDNTGTGCNACSTVPDKATASSLPGLQNQARLVLTSSE